MATMDGAVCVEVADPVVERALAYVLNEAGWTRCRCPSAARHLVTDSIAGRPATVVVVEPRPGPSVRALQAVTDGHVSAIVCSDDPDSLPDALDAAVRGMATVPLRVINAARELPPLTARQREILAAVTAGRSNRAIGAALHVSEATIKREVSSLLRLLGASNRLSLATSTIGLGVLERLPG